LTTLTEYIASRKVGRELTVIKRLAMLLASKIRRNEILRDRSDIEYGRGEWRVEAHVPIERLEFEELAPELANRLGARVRRLGYLGEFFKCAGHQPAALAAFIDFTEAGKSALDKRLVELIALTCANWMGNAYERNQHERLSVRQGFGRDWVDAVNQLAPDPAPVLQPAERRMQTLVLAILNSKGKAASALFDAAVEEWGQAQAIAVLMVIGRYVTHALIVNTLNLAPPVPSIFEDGFTA
jgi:hypothetical protein